MKINKNDLPIVLEGSGKKMRSLQGFGNMTITYNEIPAGTDFTPLLKGLKNNNCHCSHYGTVLEGVMKICYDNGKEEDIVGGDMFYIPSGHTVSVQEDLKIIIFSTTKEHHEVLTHVGKMMDKTRI